MLLYVQWCIAKNGGGYTQRGVAKGLKVPCLFMITEVSIRCQKEPAYTPPQYTTVYVIIITIQTDELAARYDQQIMRVILATTEVLVYLLTSLCR